MSNTPNMGLIENQIGVTTNPQWATNITENFNTIDSHNHSSTQGVQISPAGMDINEDLSFNENNAVDLRSSIYYNQDAVLALPTDINSSYFVDGNYYINNQNGVPVQITSGTGLNLSGVGGIGGDYGQPGVNASVIYNNTFSYYAFYSAPGIYSNILTGPLSIYNVAAASQPITIAAPTGVTPYTIILPAALPGSQSILTFSTVGVTGYVGYSSSNIANAVVQRSALGGFTAGPVAVSELTSSTLITGAGLISTSTITATTSITAGTSLNAPTANVTTLNASGGITVNVGSGTLKQAIFSGTLGALTNVSGNVPGTIYGISGQYFNPNTNLISVIPSSPLNTTNCVQFFNGITGTGNWTLFNSNSTIAMPYTLLVSYV